MVRQLPATTALLLVCACAISASQDDATGMPDHHRVVIALQPVGYWPADEGEGDVLHDRSGNGNDGWLINTPWRDGLLDFTNDFFQWAQISHRPSYMSKAFTIGGWVFSRRVHKTSRILVIGQPWVAGNSGLRWAT